MSPEPERSRSLGGVMKCTGPLTVLRTPFRRAPPGRRATSGRGQAGLSADRDAAMARAVSLSGPGWGTKTAAR